MNNLRPIRRARGLTQEALAKKSRLRQSYLSALERGMAPSRLEHVDKIARALDVPASWLSRPIAIDANGVITCAESR